MYERSKFDNLKSYVGFACSSVGKESACNAGDPGSIPGEGNGHPLQYSCLGNPLDRGAWWATAHGVTRVGHDLVTEQQQRQCKNINKIFKKQALRFHHEVLSSVDKRRL